MRPKKSTYFLLGPGVATKIELHSLWDMLKLTIQWPWDTLVAKANRKLPIYIFGNALEDFKENELHDVFQDVVDGKLKPLIDPKSPFSFTEDGVRQAMKLQASCHAQGKVVIEIAQA